MDAAGLDLLICQCLRRAALRPTAGAAGLAHIWATVAEYLVPRLLVESTRSLAAVLGPALLSGSGTPPAFRARLRELEATLVTGGPGADRLVAVLAGPPGGAFSAALAMRFARASALPGGPAGSLRTELHRLRDGVPARVRANRLALLGSAAACLDEQWRGGPYRPFAEPALVEAALSRTLLRLGRPMDASVPYEAA